MVGGLRRGACGWWIAAAIGCGDAGAPVEPTAGERPARGARIDREAAQMLAHVPDDTPYLFVNAQPLPDAYVERVEPLARASLLGWERALAKAPATGDEDADALVAALSRAMSPEGLRELGFSKNQRFAFYGFGLAPVLRLELADGAALAAVLVRADAADGERDLRPIEGGVLWTGTEGVVASALAIVGDELVAAVYPPAIESAIVPHVIGQEVPLRSLARGDLLAHARARHELLPHFFGMIDVSAIAEIVAGGGDAIARQTARSWGATAGADACGQMVRAAISRAPRMWFGLRDLDARGIRSAWIWETDAALRSELSVIAAPIVGLARSERSEGLASAGVGIDVLAAMTLAERWLDDDRWRACGSGWLARASLEAVPSWASGLTGGSAVLHDWDPLRNETSGTIVLGVDDPLGWLASVFPAADASALRRRGRPVPLAKVLGAGGAGRGDDVWVARGRHALGVAKGDGARRALRRAIDRERDDDQTWMSWSADVEGLLARVPRADVRRALAGLDDAEREWAEAVLDVIERWHGRLALADHGLELETTIELGK
jgi:hypothetical protein